MRAEGKAFFGDQGYLLAGVHFKKVAGATQSLSGVGDDLVTPRLSSDDDSSSQHSSTDIEFPAAQSPSAPTSQSRSASYAVTFAPRIPVLGDGDKSSLLPVDKTDELLAILQAPM